MAEKLQQKHTSNVYFAQIAKITENEYQAFFGSGLMVCRCRF
jgi:hypothetical protein